MLNYHKVYVAPIVFISDILSADEYNWVSFCYLGGLRSAHAPLPLRSCSARIIIVPLPYHWGWVGSAAPLRNGRYITNHLIS